MFSVLLDQFVLQQQDLFGRDIGLSAQHLHCDLDPQKYYTYTNHYFSSLSFLLKRRHDIMIPELGKLRKQSFGVMMSHLHLRIPEDAQEHGDECKFSLQGHF